MVPIPPDTVAKVTELLQQLSLPAEDGPKGMAHSRSAPGSLAALVSGNSPKPAPKPVLAPATGGIKIIKAAPKLPVGSPAGAAPSSATNGASSSYSKPAGNPRQQAAEELSYYVKTSGIRSLQSTGLLERLRAMMDDSAAAGPREGALLALGALCEHVGTHAEPYVAPFLPTIMERLSDKSPPVRVAAEFVALAFTRLVCPAAVPKILPTIFASMAPAKKWQTKEGAYKMLYILSELAPVQISAALPDIVPLVSDGMVDAREEVKVVAAHAAEAVFDLAGNRDIVQCIPALLACISQPKQVPEAVIQLSGTTFVQTVEAPALSVMVPLLLKGLREETVIKRKAAIIISNMSKLVLNPMDAEQFLPKLLPRLEQASNETPDPECRSVCAAATETLKRVVTAGQQAALDVDETDKKLSETEVLSMLQEVVSGAAGEVHLDSFANMALEYASYMAMRLVNAKNYDVEEWTNKCVGPYLSAVIPESEVAGVTSTFQQRCEAATHVAVVEEEDDGLGEQLCNCEFSLAYGGKILLNNARLRLKRGRRYGLCGHNGVGKSTLMRAINDGKVDGFPPKDELCTVYLESDIDPKYAELPLVDFVFQDPTLQNKAVPPTHEEVVNTLASVGFDDDDKKGKPVGSLSGGWKMKLALARAMLMQPDILLLDEPTNHLDVTNVAWLENYLTQCIPHVTCLVVSHDSSFLDTVCTDIIHYETRKLKYYHGNLSEFVKIKPEAKSYYELKAATLRFNFPKPTFLDGVTSQEKPILSMKKVTFTYPGADKAQLTEVTCTCRLSSRVAILGPNGAGKSTLIKILTGELKPDSGTVTKHPNVRVAYVSQHALHHLEEHLDKTPNQYLRRRYLKGEDIEEAEKVTRVLTKEEEEKIYKQFWVIDGQNRQLDKLLGRRKKKKSFEYEVKWIGLSSIAFNRWIMREELVERGFTKIVNEMDSKISAEKGESAARPLTVISVEQYLQDFGLEPEFGSHSAIKGLSGGQKVKLVLAAAMWHCPHLLVLDEPTNYLDRDSLGALAQAIKEFEGGVVMISHHSEFVGALSNEVWDLKAGRLICNSKTALPADD